MTTSSPLIKFRELMARPRFIPALGIWDPYTARVAESLGIQFVGADSGLIVVFAMLLLTLAFKPNGLGGGRAR